MDVCDIGVYDQFCYTGKTCKADKRQCLSTYYQYMVNVNPIDEDYIIRWQSDLENTKRPLH